MEDEEALEASENEEQDVQDEQDEDAVYATLQQSGPEETEGGVGHPDSCTPCTFFCFTRRGCNRGVACKFCHQQHQSKLQLRREAWKKQQREKRKMARDSEVLPSRASNMLSATSGIDNGNFRGPPEFVNRQMASSRGELFNAPRYPASVASSLDVHRVDEAWMDAFRGVGVQPPHSAMSAQMPGDSRTVVFTYTPSRVSLTMGQEVVLKPAIFGASATKSLRFCSLGAPLPRGLFLDPVSGIISGVASSSCDQAVYMVEVEMVNGRKAQAGVEIEVVDFTSGGFVIGHINEVDPGRFMLVVYKPDASQSNSGKGFD
eukprot:TRINITY_DN14376_c0_g1_i2.p1 TRINITY_DN14376_c0_g1~~TRINITY_DN14376_c0_g1_i2.p1  ORF type:complete len:333 (+),score=56.28 TRINITY_DN14376_c0_g1_i2:51-1001(+)